MELKKKAVCWEIGPEMPDGEFASPHPTEEVD
jgi:hypothetical protein